MRRPWLAVIGLGSIVAVGLSVGLAASLASTTERTTSQRVRPGLPVSPPAKAAVPLPSDDVSAVPAEGPVPVAEAFALAEWTSDGTGGLHALATRTAPWTSARLRSQWLAAPDPPSLAARAATAEILGATVVDPRAASVVVQVDVQRFWTTAAGPVTDSVPHILLLTMADNAGAWSVDDVAAVN